MELVKKLGTTPAKKVESFDQIADDAFAMIDLIDKGIEDGERTASAAALHHAQVSQNPFNFFVVADQYKNSFGGGRLRRIVINPRITDQQDYVPFEEGCLSFLHRDSLKTKRFARIRLECQYANSDGELRYHNQKSIYLTGFPAFLVQHECDHGLGKNIHDGRFDEYNPRVSLDKTK